MASARAALGKARRSMIKRQKTTGVVTGALSALGTVAAFGAGQMKKADTAWGEYEAGYKELGGDVADIQKPGLFKRTAQQFLPGGKTGLPEGEVRMGGTMYDRAKIQKAGSFLGSDAAAVLNPEQRKQFLGRTAPGTKAPGSIEGFDYSSLKGSGLSPEQYDKQVASAQRHYKEAGVVEGLPKISDPNTADFRGVPKSLQQWSVGGIGAQDYLKPSKVTSTPHMFPVGQDEPIQESEYGIKSKIIRCSFRAYIYKINTSICIV